MKMFRRLFVLSLSVCLGVSGCTLASDERVSESLNTQDAVFAFSLQPQTNDMNPLVNAGYLVLVDENGQIEAVNVGGLDSATLVWNKTGLYAGGSKNEYVITRDATTVIPRNSEQDLEGTRYSTRDQQGFISVYNYGITEEGNTFTVTAGDSKGVESWDTFGAYMLTGQCGDKVLGVTQAVWIADKASVGDHLREYSEKEISQTDVLVQLYPKRVSADGVPYIISTSPWEGVEISQKRFNPCVNDKLYDIAQRYNDPFDRTKGGGEPVLVSWDTVTGERKTMPLADPDGKPFDMTDRSGNWLCVSWGAVRDNEWWWNSCNYKTGEIFKTNLSTGVTERMFTLDLDDSVHVFYPAQFTDESVYFVFDEASQMRFVEYDLDTGEIAHSIDIEPFDFVDSSDMWARSLVVNPEWLENRKEG